MALSPEEKILALLRPSPAQAPHVTHLLTLAVGALGKLVRGFSADQKLRLAGLIVRKLGGPAAIKQQFGVTVAAALGRGDTSLALDSTGVAQDLTQAQQMLETLAGTDVAYEYQGGDEVFEGLLTRVGAANSVLKKLVG
jgi:hypothetical protein